MPQAFSGLDVSRIIVILAVLSIPVSIWAIVYFGGRIALDAYNKSQLGDMPSAEEISEHYRKLNERLLGIVDGLYIQDLPPSEQSHENPES